MSVKGMLRQLKDALGDARKNISELQDKISDMKAEREKLEHAPLCRADIEKRVDKMIEDAIAKAKPFDIRGLAQVDVQVYVGDIDRVLNGNIFSALCAFDPKRVKALLMEHMPTHGVPTDIKAAQIEKLDAEIFAAECAEELALRELEQATGGSMPRRQDANPNILVAPSNELAAAS